MPGPAYAIRVQKLANPALRPAGRQSSSKRASRPLCIVRTLALRPPGSGIRLPPCLTVRCGTRILERARALANGAPSPPCPPQEATLEQEDAHGTGLSVVPQLAWRPMRRFPLRHSAEAARSACMQCQAFVTAAFTLRWPPRLSISTHPPPPFLLLPRRPGPCLGYVSPRHSICAPIARCGANLNSQDTERFPPC